MDLRLLIVFSIILSGTLASSSYFSVYLSQSKNSYLLQVNSSTQGCGEEEKAGMLIGNVFIYYSSLCSTVSSPSMANLSNTNERHLVLYIRNTCNGLRSCSLVKENMELKTKCRDLCTCPVLYYLFYSCHPVVPDNKIIFDMSNDFNTTFDTHTTAINVYLVLQRQHLVYQRTCCIEANGIGIAVRLMNTPSALTVQNNGATEIIDDRYYNISKRFYGVVKLCFTQNTLMEHLWFHLTDASANQIFTISCRGEKSNTTATDTFHQPVDTPLLAVSVSAGCLAIIAAVMCIVFVCRRRSCFRRRQTVVSKNHFSKVQLQTEYVNVDLNGELDEIGVDKISDRNVVSETKSNYIGYSSEHGVYNEIQPTDMSDKPGTEDMVDQRSNPAETYSTICNRPADNECNVPGSPSRVISPVGELTSCDIYSTPNKVKKNKDVVAPPTQVDQYSHLSHLRQGQDDLTNTYDG